MTYDWRKDPDLVWPEDKREQENKMIAYIKTETKEVSCVLMIAETKGAVTRYLQATEEDLKAAGYVPNAHLPGRADYQTLVRRVEEKNDRIDALEKELEEMRDTEIVRLQEENKRLRTTLEKISRELARIIREA